MQGKRRYKTGFHPFRFFLGYDVITVRREMLADTINLCRLIGIGYKDISTNKSDECALLVPFFASSRLLKAARERELPIDRPLRCGLPAILLRGKERLGIPIGILAVTVMIILSQNVIWDIRIDGTSQVSEDEVKDILNECGLHVGSKKSSVKPGKIENMALILSDDISWISVNVIGTVVKVQIRELDFFEDEDDCAASNVIASTHGTIVGFEDIRGQICVNIGDAVSQGQLLISGIYGDEENGFRYTNAKGTVLAEVEREFSVNVPRNYVKKEYTGRAKQEKYLIFFEKEVKIFGNCGNLYPLYDKIEVEEYLLSPSGDELPVGIRTVTYSEYAYKNVTRTDDELSALAQYKLSADMALTLRDSQLLKKSIQTSIANDKITLICRASTIENIAKRQEIEISGFPERRK